MGWQTLPMDVFERRRLALLEMINQSSQAEICRRTGMAAPLVSNYASEPEKKGHKNIGDKVARRLEKAHRWTMFSMDTWPEKPRILGGSSLIELPLFQDVPHIEWGALMSTKLPHEFSVDMPDDSMEPRIRRGKRLYFSTGEAPRAGDCILVRDGLGHHSVRVYRERRPGVWQAAPINTDFEPLEAERDQLSIVGVLVAEGGRWT